MAQITIDINDDDYQLIKDSGFDLSAFIGERLHKIVDFKKLSRERERRLYKAESDNGFKYVNAVYTGGNIWLFYGQLNNQEYFLTDDNGCTLILDESPENFDESLEVEWQETHTKRELLDDERVTFCNALADRLLRHHSIDDFGGITDDEIKAYKNYWPMPM